MKVHNKSSNTVVHECAVTKYVVAVGALYIINTTNSRVGYRLVQIERPKLCPRLMTNAIPNQYAQIWYRRKAREKIKLSLIHI